MFGAAVDSRLARLVWSEAARAPAPSLLANGQCDPFGIDVLPATHGLEGDTGLAAAWTADHHHADTIRGVAPTPRTRHEQRFHADGAIRCIDHVDSHSHATGGQLSTDDLLGNLLGGQNLRGGREMAVGGEIWRWSSRLGTT